MKPVIQFELVSKQYRLGLTRTSLPALISEWVKASRLSGRRRNYDERYFWALRDVTFELRAGQSLALVGANGAGKTTILKLLANITKPTSGRLMTKGKLSALIELGAGFHPDLTGRENIFLNGTILGLNRQEIGRRFDEIVAFSELERFIDTPVKRYSSGMIVRLGFAVASCIEPEILLVDEVLAVGDASFQQKCLSRIRSLISHGTSIIFVSHNLYLLQAVCSSALYLQKGQVIHHGSTRDVIDRYEKDLHRERAQKFKKTDEKTDDSGGDILITRVEVLNRDGSAVEALPSDQPAQIRIHYDANKALGRIQASAFIIRSDGLTCCMMRTRLDRFDLCVESGQGVITLHLEPLQLVSGTYFAEAWLLNESDSMGLTSKAGRSDWFSVKGTALSYEESSGIFEPKTRWSHSGNGTIGNEDASTSVGTDSLPAIGWNEKHREPVALGQRSDAKL